MEIKAPLDGIPPLFLKKFSELSEPMCNLFNISKQQGYVPIKNGKSLKLYLYDKGKGSMLEVKIV